MSYMQLTRRELYAIMYPNKKETIMSEIQVIDYSDDIDLLISPDMTFGTPHNLCRYKNIPILVVEENKTVLPPAKGKCIRVANYIEAAGWVASTRAGISPQSVRRPIEYTTIIN